MNPGNFKIGNVMPAGAWRKQIQSDYLMLPAAAAWSRTVCKLVKGPNLSLSSLWFKRQGKKVLSSVDKQEKMYKLVETSQRV